MNHEAPEVPKKRPGGPLQGRPIQSAENEWTDQFGEDLPENELKDLEWAAKFWSHQPKGVRETMENYLESALKDGFIGVFINSSGEIDNRYKEKMSAYRQLARELGYEVGQFQLNRKSGTATMPIGKNSLSV